VITLRLSNEQAEVVLAALTVYLDTDEFDATDAEVEDGGEVIEAIVWQQVAA